MRLHYHKQMTNLDFPSESAITTDRPDKVEKSSIHSEILM